MHSKLRGGIGIAVCLLSAMPWSAGAQTTGTDAKPAAVKPAANPPADKAMPPMKSPDKGTPPIGDAQPPPARPAAKTEAKRSLDMLKAPGSILVICEEAKNALGLLPQLVVLTPEKYQELLDQVENLKRQAKPVKPDTPSACKLTGQVEGDIVRFQAEFEFRTDRPRSQVALGCQRGWPSSAHLDGQLPLLLPGDDGLVVQVDTPGAHKLTLELALPLQSRGAKGTERGFDLGLPRAAITLLESFTVNSAVAEVRVNGRSVRARRLDAQHSRLESVLLGPAEHLDLSWKGTAPQPQKGPPLLAAEGRLQVRLEENQVTTHVDLNLQVLRGETQQWRILLPPHATLELKEPVPQDERLAGREPPSPREPWLTLRLKEPSSEPLRVVLQYTQARKSHLAPVGPVLVLDAFRQRGTIAVTAPPEMRVRYHRRGDVSQREVTDELRRDKAVAAFTYWNLPQPVHVSQPVPAPLDLEIETIKGATETRVEHQLTLTDTTGRLTTRIEASPIRMGIDRLDLRIPADFQFDKEKGASPAELVEEVVIHAEKQLAQIKLVHKRTEPFVVTVPALVTVPPGRQQIHLELPRPIQTLDRGGQLAVALPEGRELLPPEDGGDALPPGTRRHTWRWDRAPASQTISWRDYRPEMPVESVVDITCANEQAVVRQRLDFQFSDPPPSQVALTIPAKLSGRVRVLQGGVLGANGVVTLESMDTKVSVVLSYVSRLESPVGLPTAAGQVLTIPLVQARQATRVETKVRIWSAAGERLQPAADEGWDVQPAEAVADKDSLPTLVLRSENTKAPLTLVRTTTTASSLAPVIIERALVQVMAADGGYQNYRARFLLSRLGARHLDLEFPAPIGSLNAALTLDGKTPRSQTVDAVGKEVDNGTILRLAIDPDLYRQPVLLDIRYQIAPGRTRGNHFLHSAFYPPRIKGDVFLGGVRWQVGMPAGWIFLAHQGGFGAELRWDWRGGLLTPRSAVSSSDLERWLVGPKTTADAPAASDEGLTTLVCWRSELEPLRMLQAPQQGWLLLCSLLFLTAGLGLSYGRPARALFWTIVAGLGLALAYAGMYWPSVLPMVLYGCEPAGAILLLVLAVQWLLQQHFRRQAAYLPGFSRRKADASLVRDGSQHRPRPEPSTVDAPRARDSSLTRGPGSP